MFKKKKLQEIRAPFPSSTRRRRERNCLCTKSFYNKLPTYPMRHETEKMMIFQRFFFLCSTRQVLMNNFAYGHGNPMEKLNVKFDLMWLCWEREREKGKRAVKIIETLLCLSRDNKCFSCKECSAASCEKDIHFHLSCHSLSHWDAVCCRTHCFSHPWSRCHLIPTMLEKRRRRSLVLSCSCQQVYMAEGNLKFDFFFAGLYDV